MNEEPFIPFYKPYGMSEEEYQNELCLAQNRYDQWAAEQDQTP